MSLCDSLARSIGGWSGATSGSSRYPRLDSGVCDFGRVASPRTGVSGFVLEGQNEGSESTELAEVRAIYCLVGRQKVPCRRARYDC